MFQKMTQRKIREPEQPPKIVIFNKIASFRFFCFLSLFGKLIGFIAPEMVPWLSKQSEDQSGGPKTNLQVFGDEVSFQYFQKT